MTGRTATQTKPAIAADHEGNFVICWQDSRSGDTDIYAQRYNSMGQSQGNNFKVNHDSGDHSQSNPSVAMDSTGNFIICWADDRNGDGDIFAQMYDSSGAMIGSSFQVNDDAQGNVQSHPNIGVDHNGNFVICWGDGRNSGDFSDIYAQRFDNTGAKEGINFKVNDDSGQFGQYSPKVALDDEGNFVMCWEDERNGIDSDIYAQRFNKSGTNLGTNFLVSSVADSPQLSPDISIDDSGRFVICWQDYSSDLDYGEIWAKRYDSQRVVLNNYIVNNGPNPREHNNPTVGLNGTGKFVICWEDGKDNLYGDIFGQRFNENGARQDDNFKVNDVSVSVSQYQPAVAAADNGNFIVCWVDGRNDGTDIYAQRLDGNGAFLGNNFLVSDDNQGKDQWNPEIGLNSSGGFVVCWTDERNYNQNIYAQRYDNNGNALGANFKVNDTDDPASKPDIAVSEDGSFIICWMDARYSSEYDIYAQRFDSNGNPVGANFKVNDDNEQYIWHMSPAITVDGSDRFVICWEDERNGPTDIYCQRFAADGSPLGSNFKINDAGEGSQRWQADVAADSAGNFIVCWNDDRAPAGSDVYAQLYDQNGAPQGANFRVNENTGADTQWYPAVAVTKTSNFVVVWSDTRNGDDDIYAQQFTISGRRLGSNYRVNNDASSTEQREPDVACGDSTIYFTWQDGRDAGHGWDIYARIENFLTPKTVLSLPDTTGAVGETIGIPITVSTDSAVGFAQFVIEFDSTLMTFSGSQLGANALGFQISATNTNLPFQPTHSDANKNVLLQISGGGTSSFSGENQQILILTFDVVGSPGDSAGIYFDGGTNRTFLTTTNLYDIKDGDIDFNEGTFKIPETITISGYVFYDGTDKIVPNTEIDLDGMSSATTNNGGLYSFSEVAPGPHTLTPAKANDANDAISGADALAVLQSLAFLITLSDEQKIAADVTLDSHVTGADAMAILRYLAFFTSNIAHTGQWYFSPEDTTFTANTNTSIDFKAYLKGDVNLSWSNSALLSKNGRNESIFDLKFGAPVQPETAEISIPLILNTSDEKMNTLLFSMTYPASALKFKRVELAQNLRGFQNVTNSEKEGELHLAIAGAKGVRCNGEMAHFIFKKTTAQKSTIELRFTRAIANDLEMKDLPILTLDQNLANVPEQFKLFQNYPNPFNSETVIEYQLPRDVHVKLAIYNSLGQRIRTLVDENQKSGIYSIRWNGKSDDDKVIVSGIYLVRIETEGFSANKKLILLK